MQNISKQNYRLGLDLGTNSIGWAILGLNENNEPYKILDAGVRIFSDGRNPKDGKPLAVARREARSMRRRRDRFLARKSKLMNCLIRLGLMPQDEIERKKLESLNPYQLRCKALDETLNSSELGRAIFHLNQRRGFKSNRKEQVSDDKKLSETKQNQEDLAKKIVETNSRTLGEFFYKERILKELTARAKPDESGLYPTRDMYENEFDEIKKAQFPSQKLSEENWQEIRKIIFDQRPLAPQEKGVCRFVNNHNYLPNWAAEIFENYKKLSKKNEAAKGLPRAYLALPSYQRFRILSEINNLKIIKNNREEISLDATQKRKLVEYLHQKKSANFSLLRKQIGFGAEEFRFNFEGGKRDKFDGNATEIFLKDPKHFGEKWHNFSLQKQDEIIEFLLDSEDENQIYQKALNAWQLSEEQALAVKKITPSNFKSGVGNLSKELLQKLVTEISEKNCRYDEAIKNLGFHHSEKEFGEIKDQLDYYGKVLQASIVPVKYGSKEEIDFGKIANPTVHAALNQLRKVVNAIIKENGNPSEIHIELARDLKISKDEKRQIEKNQSKNQKENEEFGKELERLNQRNTYDNRLKLKLFRELEKSNNGVACCPYSGRLINITNLFSHDVEIEHILPFAKTYDDSIVNKTIAYRSENQKKGNRSPFEAFGDATFERIKNLPKNKSWRFYENAMEKFKDESGFQERQLNDTRYLSKIARQYLAQICDYNKIKVANGKLTALLRHNWGLNSILNPNLDKQENQANEAVIEDLAEEIIDAETGEVFVEKTKKIEKKNQKPKNRDDHRHHAIDAIVIAMTETRLLQQLSRDNARGHDLNRLIINVPSHWNRFREDVVEAIERIIVSHKPDHGKNGQFHEETYYGVIDSPVTLERKDGKDEGYNFVYSKPLAGLSENEIERIRDQKIYQDLKKRLAGTTDKKEIADILSNYKIQTKNNEIKVKNVRLLKKENRFSIISNKQLTLQKKKIGGVEEKTHTKAVVGSNHHIAIWELPKLSFLPLFHLKGKKLEATLDKLSEAEKTKFERFKAHQEKTKNWISKDCEYAVSCTSSFEAAKDDENLFKPHPAAKLLTKIHNGDLIRLKLKDLEVVAKTIKLVPSNDGIALLKHNETGKEVKQIWLSFSKFKESELTKIFITPTGKVFDSGPILKTKNPQEK
jgi:CRISPR-associated endonuclease Csn1